MELARAQEQMLEIFLVETRIFLASWLVAAAKICSCLDNAAAAVGGWKIRSCCLDHSTARPPDESCWWSFQVQASKPASLLHTSMHLQALLRSCTDVAILKIDSFSAKFPDDTHCKTFVFFSGPNLINLKLSNPEH